VREVVGLPSHELAGDDVGVAEVLPGAAELERDEGVEAGPQARRHSAVDELADEAAGGGFLEARDVGDIGQPEYGASPLVQRRDELGRAGAEGLGLFVVCGRLSAVREVRDGISSGICYTEATVTEVFATEDFVDWW
jgi:hypothetical protein